MDGSTSENKGADQPTVIRAVSVQKNEYFFPGGGKWKPMTIVATNRETAEEIHREKREPLATAEEGKVEASETNNE